VWVTGCPSIDLALRASQRPDPRPTLFENFGGVGPSLDLSGDFLMVLQHPVTNEQEQAGDQIGATLEAVERSGLPALWFWPNMDAGTDAVSKRLRAFHESHRDAPIHWFRHLPPLVFLRLMACPEAIMVGNSSAAIREGSFLGTRAVNIGTRQQGRECAANVSHVSPSAIAAGLESLRQWTPDQSTLYGDGHAGETIARLLAR
jgi:UDP-N-acetylglucosamine 2-epimerase